MVKKKKKRKILDWDISGIYLTRLLKFYFFLALKNYD